MKLLDCTLRDGGYINNWNFGEKVIRDILSNLVNSNIDIIEIGFLRDENTSSDRSVFNNIQQIKNILPTEKKNSKFSAMILHDKYNFENLEQNTRDGIDILRITFHNYDYKEGLEKCEEAINKGYLVSCNPINIMGYTDKQLLELIDIANSMPLYAFSIVDTFGSMGRKDLDRFVSMLDHNLKKEIAIGLHLHENKSQSFYLAQSFIEKHLQREIIVDGSLSGMGRAPGNLCIELIADYLNEEHNSYYEIDHLLDAIDNYIEPIKRRNPWGYSASYFLSAKYNLHRNYAEFLLSQGKLTSKDINHILNDIEDEKKAAFDKEYIKDLYEQYTTNEIDDAEARLILSRAITGKNALILAPGKTLKTHQKQIEVYCTQNNPLIFALNYIPDNYKNDFAIFMGSKRYEQYFNPEKCKTIITSNINGKADFILNNSSLFSSFAHGTNSLVMTIKLLHELGAKKIGVAGADGYAKDSEHYCDSSIISYIEHDMDYNREIGVAIKKLKANIEFITPSLYET